MWRHLAFNYKFYYPHWHLVVLNLYFKGYKIYRKFAASWYHGDGWIFVGHLIAGKMMKKKYIITK
jgi:hypothetical protein